LEERRGSLFGASLRGKRFRTATWISPLARLHQPKCLYGQRLGLIAAMLTWGNAKAGHVA